jgi:hypothetical protein
MAIDVTRAALIRRSRADVASFMFDPANDAIWTTSVVECRPLIPGRLRAGSRVERISEFLGHRVSYVYEVLAVEGDRFVEISIAKPFSMLVRYDLEERGEATMARIRASGDGGRFFSMAAPILNLVVGQNIAKDLAQLQRHLESGSRISSGSR